LLHESTTSNKSEFKLSCRLQMYDNSIDYIGKIENNITCPPSTVTNLVEENVLIIYVHDAIL